VATFNRPYRSYPEAIAFVHALALRRRSDWAAYCRGERRDLANLVAAADRLSAGLATEYARDAFKTDMRACSDAELHQGLAKGLRMEQTLMAAEGTFATSTPDAHQHPALTCSKYALAIRGCVKRSRRVALGAVKDTGSVPDA
jgi:hypothetical protein